MSPNPGQFAKYGTVKVTYFSYIILSRKKQRYLLLHFPQTICVGNHINYSTHLFTENQKSYKYIINIQIHIHINNNNNTNNEIN